MPVLNSGDTGLLLVGHGTRSAAGTGCTEQLRALVAQRLPAAIVERCFLELHPATIQAAMARLSAHNLKRLVVSPILLFEAGHAKADIPAEVAASLVGLKGIAVCQAPVLGCNSAIVDLSYRRFLQAIDDRPPLAAEKTCLLLVGRGSRDEQATAEMHRFAQLRNEQTPGLAVAVAFMAMAEPQLPAVISRLKEEGFLRIVVQPHLLFPGDLLDSVEQATQEASTRSTRTEWIAAPALAADLGTGGPADSLLPDAIIEHANRALAQLSV